MVAPLLICSITKKLPLKKDKTESTIIKTKRSFDILLARQKVSASANGPPYIAGEVIITTAKASDSMAKEYLMVNTRTYN
jgi:hypothetical protein